MNVTKALQMLEKIVLTSIDALIKNTISAKKLDQIKKKQAVKLHFIPFEYRVFGGILQSMNIQFGNFIKELMKELLTQSDCEILGKLSAKKNKISSFTDSLIDTYITRAQNERNFALNKEFAILKEQILQDKNIAQIQTKHDIDLLFKDKNGQIYYVEIKYNDDHDMDKFVGLNRKFIKTYAYLVREFNKDIKAILFYFNNKKMKDNIYLPEQECIYRGERFFKEFLNFDYYFLQKLLKNFSNKSENIARFDELYHFIVKENAKNE